MDVVMLFFYTKSSGTIDTCIVSPNQKGNMANLAIRAHFNSSIQVENCVIKNYGRIGIYIRTGTTLNAINNKIIGQIYTDDDGDYVSYGIEVEDLMYTSHATIQYNEIYNHDHIGNPTWSSAAIIVDTQPLLLIHGDIIKLHLKTVLQLLSTMISMII